ncbi:MAG: hypothetical protein Q9214_004673, partial [Letrouitia sp. 1 TL-2023]
MKEVGLVDPEAHETTTTGATVIWYGLEYTSLRLWNMPAMMVIDSHVHLYPRSEVDTLAWCSEGHPLHGQHSVNQYLQAIKPFESQSHFRFRGFIFVETDRKSHLDSEAGWEGPLKELDWIDRIVQGRPRPDEDHSPDHAHLCYAVVLWAPVPLGAQAMSTYYDKIKHRANNLCHLVKGFRYLVQDKPSGTMLTNGFVDSLRWMGESGFAFDLGVDVRSGGLWQLSEAYEMIHRAHDGVSEDKQVRIVI